MTLRQFTCLIPAYNEAERIGGVLTAIAGHKDLQQVIVINDGSTDQTAQVALAFGVTVLTTPGNLGKTAALAFGLQHVKTSHVVLLDADLLGLTALDVARLIAPVLTDQAIASISLRGNAPKLWRMIGLDYISGERALPFDLLKPHLDELNKLPRFGFEVFLNRLLIKTKRPIAIVPFDDVASPYKATKLGFWRGLGADALMIRDILLTVSLIEIVTQIIMLKRRQLSAANLPPSLRRSAQSEKELK